MKVRGIGRIIFLALLGTVAIVIALISPLYVLLASIGVFSFLLLSRQLNFYRIVMLLKRFIRNASKLRLKIRAKLHMGFRDYSNIAVESEEDKLRNRNCGYIR